MRATVISVFQCNQIKCKLVYLVFIILVYGSHESHALARGASCTTPNEESATCIPVDDCTVIRTAIATYSRPAIDFARRSQCGYDTDPLVCCGNTSVLTVSSPDIRTNMDTSNINELVASLENTLPSDSVCGVQRDNERVGNPPNTTIYEYPWLALIRYRYNNGSDAGFKCGGTLINNRYVLTAAHCLLTEPEEFHAYSVRLGEWDISSDRDCYENVCADPVKDWKIIEQIVHPFYKKRSGTNDIALIRLENNINYTDFIRPICLPAPNARVPLPDAIMTVSGWGSSGANSQKSDKKLKIQLPIVSLASCSSRISNSTRLTQNHICAGGRAGVDACGGFSGGPLMKSDRGRVVQWYQYGIVSRGRGCGIQGIPGIYTNVAGYITWILNNLRRDRGSPCITPNGQRAICSPVATCAPIKNAIYFRNDSAVQFAQESQCGYDTEALVCCGSIGYYTDSLPNTLVDKVFVSSKNLPSSDTCGMQTEHNNIYGGDITAIDEFPWMALLMYSENGVPVPDMRCGGSLINDRYVLTAAHCIWMSKYATTKLTSVRLGEWNISSSTDCVQNVYYQVCSDPAQDISVQRQLPHPLYNTINGDNDIGLLQLERSVQYTDFIRPICLPSSNAEEIPAGRISTVTGWGITENGSLPDVKLKVEVAVVSNEECLKEYTKTRVGDNQVCAGGVHGKDSCLGDSGGPLMITSTLEAARWYQLGVIFRGNGCGRSKIPAVYTRVNRYIGWILSSIRQERGSSCTTPNGEIAECVPIANCTIIADAVKTRPPAAVEFAQNSQCGYDVDILVCCGSTANFSKAATTDFLTPQFTTSTNRVVIRQMTPNNVLPDRTVCGLHIETDRIYGGQYAKIDEFPWTALLRYNNPDGSDAGFHCAGSLINNRYVLTSAHCITVDPNHPKNLTGVRLGEWKLSTTEDCQANDCADPTVDLGIEEVISHPLFSQRTADNNVAILRLERSVPFTDFIQPICLPPENSPILSEGKRTVVAGWGNTESGNSADIKLKVELPIVSNNDCLKRHFNNHRVIGTNQVCAGGASGKDTCKGDGGAPLMATFSDDDLQWYQEGVVAWGTLYCGTQGYPGVYTRVARYVSWVQHNLRE